MEIKAKVRIQEGADSERCPYCLDGVNEDDIAVCDRCGTKHHASCFMAHGVCTVLGCNGQPMDAAGLLEESEQLAILEAAKKKRGNARARAVERMLRDGVPLSLVEREFAQDAMERLLCDGMPLSVVEREFAQDSDGRIFVAILGTRLRSGNREAGHTLIRLARDPRESFQVRAAALRALALQQETPEGTIETALLCLEQGSLKNRAEWILRSCSAEEIIQITVAASQGFVPPKVALKGLIATYSGFNGQERAQRIAELNGLRERVQGDLAHVLLDAALAKDALLSIPTTTASTDHSDLETQFRVALVTGSLLSAVLILLAFGLSQQAGESAGLGLEILWMIAKSFAALSIGVTGGLGVLLSSRKNRDLERKDRLRVRHQRAKEAYEKTLQSPVWTQKHIRGTSIDDGGKAPPHRSAPQKQAPLKGH